MTRRTALVISALALALAGCASGGTGGGDGTSGFVAGAGSKDMIKKRLFCHLVWHDRVCSMRFFQAEDGIRDKAT